MFTDAIERDGDGLLKTVKKQYHIEPDGKLHVVDDVTNTSKNNVTFTFTEGGIYKGTATVDRSNVEVDKNETPLSNFGQKGCC
jgi:hypothetical protein